MKFKLKVSFVIEVESDDLDLNIETDATPEELQAAVIEAVTEDPICALEEEGYEGPEIEVLTE